MTTTSERKTTKRPVLPFRGVQSVSDSGLWLIFVVGILIRLALMPFTFHSDLYSVYSRSYDAVSTGHWFTFSSQILVQLVHNVWFAMVQPLLPNSSGIWSPTAGVIGVGVQPGDLTRFLAYPHLARALFLLKLPYFFADLGTGYVLTRFVEPRWRRRVLALWLLNPIVIFVSAVFGRHDSLSIFVVMLSALLAIRGRRYLGMVLLGIGAAARFFPAFLAPFYALAFRRSRRELALLIGGLVGFWLLIEIVVIAATGNSPTLTLLNRYPHIEYLFAMNIDPGTGDSIFFFPLGYTLVLLWFIERGSGRSDAYVPIAATILLVMFALTHFNPQYAIWIVPFLVLAIYRDEYSIALHAGQILLLVLLTFQWGSAVTWGLFQPMVGNGVNTIPDPMTIVGALMPVNIYNGVVRTLFSTVSLWIGYRIMRSWRQSRAPVPLEELSHAYE